MVPGSNGVEEERRRRAGQSSMRTVPGSSLVSVWEDGGGLILLVMDLHHQAVSYVTKIHRGGRDGEGEPESQRGRERAREGERRRDGRESQRAREGEREPER